MLILPIYLGYFRFTFDLVLVVVLFCFYYRAPNGPCCHTGNPRKDLMESVYKSSEKKIGEQLVISRLRFLVFATESNTLATEILLELSQYGSPS